MLNLIFIFIFYSCVHRTTPDKERLNHIQEMKKIYKNSGDSPYPNENFIFLYKTLYDKTMHKNIKVSSASGMIFKKEKNDKLYALTAAHWCVDKASEMSQYHQIFGHESAEEFEKTLSIRGEYFGKEHEIEIIDMNLERDVCLLGFKSDYANQAKNVKIAKNHPKIGEKIYTASAPQGVANKRIRLHFEGKFAGCIDIENECWYTIPGIYGSSGSAVLNDKGEIVGILTFAMVQFHNVTGGVMIEDIRNIIDKNLQGE